MECSGTFQEPGSTMQRSESGFGIIMLKEAVQLHLPCVHSAAPPAMYLHVQYTVVPLIHGFAFHDFSYSC